MLLVPRRLSTSRRFPHLSWAWPNGGRERLLVAAAHADAQRAAQALLDWLSSTDLDNAQFAEQRLLVRAANRFPETRLKVPDRARLNGIVRLLWTRSRLSLDGAAPVLKALREAGVELLVLKGMAQAALDVHNLKGRIAHDIDILVRASDLPVALPLLDGAGWRSARGESGLFLKERGASFRTLNLVKPPFGDIDLHTRAYLTTSYRSEAETGIWSRSARARLLDIDVLVPSPTDRLMNAIAHGALDAHHHSDWLVDIAQLVGEGNVDWPLVVRLARDLAIPAQATLALSYLREALGCTVPEEALDFLWEEARNNWADYFKALLLGYPREQHSLVSGIGRRFCKMHQRAQVLAANAAAGPPSHPQRMWRVRPPTALPDTPPALRHRLAVARGAQRCSIVVGLDAACRARRYVFEINSGDRHLARLGFKDRLGRGQLLLGAEFALPNDVGTDDIWIEARQSGILRAMHSAEDDAKFGPTPFRLQIR
jgi:hypothetical protein